MAHARSRDDPRDRGSSPGGTGSAAWASSAVALPDRAARYAARSARPSPVSISPADRSLDQPPLTRSRTATRARARTQPVKSPRLIARSPRTRSRRQAAQGRNGAGLGQANRRDAGRRAGCDDPRGRLVAQAVVGDQPDAERAVAQKLDVAAEAAAEGGKVRQDGFPQPQSFQVPQVVGLGADQQVVLQVGIERPRRAGPGPSRAAPRARPRGWPAGAGRCESRLSGP